LKLKLGITGVHAIPVIARAVRRASAGKAHVFRKRNQGIQFVVMLLNEHRTAPLIEPFREPVGYRKNGALMRAQRRHDGVNPARRLFVQTPAMMVAPLAHRARRARFLLLAIALEKPPPRRLVNAAYFIRP
jgi:hypothetical protein